MKKKIINIYTGNHILEFLIEDIVKIIKEIFSKNNFEVIVSRNDILLNGNNIFLELFTNLFLTFWTVLEDLKANGLQKPLPRNCLV